MNLRILKKLSKRAATLLPLMGDNREQFPSERWDNHVSLLITARKHWDRSSCHPTYEPINQYSTPKGMPVKHVTRAGRTIVIRPPSEPRKGTIMVGAMSGYYEPEWDEQTAWEALVDQVRVHFTDWSEDGPCPLTRKLETASDFLRAAEELVAERTQQKEG